ncbi:MAG: hypothetical protein R2795_04520 [Saprospiraceae bacterium]
MRAHPLQNFLCGLGGYVIGEGILSRLPKSMATGDWLASVRRKTKYRLLRALWEHWWTVAVAYQRQDES